MMAATLRFTSSRLRFATCIEVDKTDLRLMPNLPRKGLSHKTS